MTVYNPKFETYQGADIVINFTIFEDDGYTAENMTGWALAANFMPVVTNNTDEDLIKTVGSGIEYVVAASGTGTITLTAAETQEMAPGDWEYDLWRTDANTTYPLLLGSFTLTATPRSRNSDT